MATGKIHFKLRSEDGHRTVSFTGHYMNLLDLKAAIVKQVFPTAFQQAEAGQQIKREDDFELELKDAKTNEVFDDEEKMIPTNSAFLVRRYVVQGVNGRRVKGLLERLKNRTKKGGKWGRNFNSKSNSSKGSTEEDPEAGQNNDDGADQAEKVKASAIALGLATDTSGVIKAEGDASDEEDSSSEEEEDSDSSSDEEDNVKKESALAKIQALTSQAAQASRTSRRSKYVKRHANMQLSGDALAAQDGEGEDSSAATTVKSEHGGTSSSPKSDQSLVNKASNDMKVKLEGNGETSGGSPRTNGSGDPTTTISDELSSSSSSKALEVSTGGTLGIKLGGVVTGGTMFGLGGTSGNSDGTLGGGGAFGRLGLDQQNDKDRKRGPRSRFGKGAGKRSILGENRVPRNPAMRNNNSSIEALVRREQGIPHPSYICKRCQQRGHYYNNCPYKDDPAYDKQRNVKKMSGVPRAFMKRVDNIDNVGARDDADARMFVSGGGTGEYAVIQANEHVFRANLRAKTATAMKDGAGGAGGYDPKDVPKHLLCKNCKKLVRNAVIMSCCGETTCDDCMRETLIKTKFKCPFCQEHTTLDGLVPNKGIRRSVEAFLEEQRQKFLKEEAAKTANTGERWVVGLGGILERPKTPPGEKKKKEEEELKRRQEEALRKEEEAEKRRRKVAKLTTQGLGGAAAAGGTGSLDDGGIFGSVSSTSTEKANKHNTNNNNNNNNNANNNVNAHQQSFGQQGQTNGGSRDSPRFQQQQLMNGSGSNTSGYAGDTAGYAGNRNHNGYGRNHPQNHRQQNFSGNNNGRSNHGYNNYNSNNNQQHNRGGPPSHHFRGGGPPPHHRGGGAPYGSRPGG
eukprot:g2988.t1